MNDFVVAGTANSNFVVGAYNNTAGTLSGSTQVGFAGATAVANGLAVQSNGRIVLAGYALDTTTGDSSFALARFTSTLAVDTTFGTGGQTTTSSVGASLVAQDVTVESDGKIVVGGYYETATVDDFAVAKYVADNSPTFNSTSASLVPIVQNQSNSSGESVSALTVASRLGVSDIDGDSLGIAITSADNSNGSFQYSTDGGATFNPITGVSTTHALLLAATTTNVIRFVPNTNFAGNAAFGALAYDLTQGVGGGFYDTTFSSAHNLNAFSDATATVTQTVVSAPADVYVNSTWAGSAQGATVADSLGVTHTYGVDGFSTVANGINYVAVAGTVHVDGGTTGSPLTYAEIVGLTRTETVAGYGQATPTLTAPASVSQAVILSVNAANSTVQNLKFVVDQPRAAAAIGAIDTYSAATTFNGLRVLGNVITTTGTGGKLQQDSAYGPTNKYSAGIVLLSGQGGSAPSVTIQGNSVATLFSGSSIVSTVGRGIWAYAITGTIGGSLAGQGNSINVESYQDIQTAFSSGTLYVTGNTLTGTGLTVTEPNGPVDIGGNTFAPLGGVDDGAIVIRHNYTAANTITVHGNAFTMTTGTIGVLSTASTGVTVSGNTFQPAAGSSNTVAIDVDTQEPTNSHNLPDVPDSITVTGNTFNASGTSATAVLVGDHDTGATTDADFGTVTIGGAGSLSNTFAAGLANFIVLSPSSNTVTFSGDTVTAFNPGPTPVNIDATGNAFGVSSGHTGASQTLADKYEIEDKITDRLDYPGLGYVKIVAGNVYLTQLSETTTSDSLQRAVDVTSGNDVVHVAAGTFVGDVYVPNALSIQGAQYGTSPTTTVPATSTQTVISLASTDPFDDTVIQVGADNVTIDGVTIDGSIPTASANTTAAYGANVLGGDGVGAYDGENNVVVRNSILQHLSDSGVDLYNAAAGHNASSGNVVSNNVIRQLGVATGPEAGIGIGVILYYSAYAQVTGNVMTDVRTGVQTGNFDRADTGAAPSIANNTITAAREGIFYNLHFTGATAFNLSGNTIHAETTAASPVTKWDGIEIASQQTAVSVTASNNTIDGSGITDPSVTKAGVIVWNTPTTGTILVTGGSITGVNYGVWANTYEGYNSNGDTTHVDVSNLFITATTAGLYVEDSPANSNHPRVSASLTQATVTAPIDVLVSGANASASIYSNDLQATTTGIEVDNGTLTVGTNNSVTNGVTGLVLNGSTANLVGNTISNLGFFNQSSNYILLAGGAENNQTIDATAARFDGLTGATATLAQSYAIEDKIADYIDAPGVGFVRIATGNVYVTQLSETTTAGAIQRGVNAAVGGDVVHVQAGSYFGAVNIAKNVSVIGAGEGTNAASNTLVTAPSGQSSSGVTGVFTISASGANAAAPLILQGLNIGLNYTAGVLYVNGAGLSNEKLDHVAVTGQHLTGEVHKEFGVEVDYSTSIDGLTISNSSFRQTFIGFDSEQADLAAPVTLNHINISSSDFSDNQAKGIYTESLENATLTNLTVNNNGYDQTFSNHNANIGIDINLKGQAYSNITISNLTAMNNGVGATNGVGLSIKARGTGNDPSYAAHPATLTNVNVSGGTITGNQGGIRVGEPGRGNTSPTGVTITGANVSGNTTVGIALAGGSSTITNTTINNNGIGLDFTGGQIGAGSGSLTIAGNTVGIHDSATNGQVAVSGLTVSGSTTGIAIDAGASLSVSNTTLTNDTTAVSDNNATIAFGTGDVINGGTTGVALNGSTTAVTGNTFSNLSFNGVSGNYIALTNGAENGVTLDGTAVSYDGVTGSSATNAQAFAIEDKILDALDTPGVGYVRVKANTVFVTLASENASNGAISRAVAAAASGDTVAVQAGTYRDNVTISKPLTIAGANAGVAGSNNSRGAETAVIPAANGQSAVFTVSGTTNVTIDGITVDGYNPALAGAALYSGDTSDVSYGIHTAGAVSNLTVQNDIVKRVFIGFRGDGLSTGNKITNNLFDSVGNFDFGYSVTLRSDFYADVTNNVMTRTWTGVHINNFHNAGGPAAFNISGNTIQDYAGGIMSWLQYGSATPVTISNNQISVQSGRPPVANNFGISIVSLQDNDSVSITNDSITGTDVGVVIFNASTSHPVTLGSTVQIVGTKVAGVQVTDNLTVNPIGTTNFVVSGPGAAETVNLTGLSINASSGAGVIVDASGNTSTSAIATGVTVLGTAAVGVKATGSRASVDLTTDEFLATVTGIQIDGAKLTLGSGNVIDGAATGVALNGSTTAVTGNTFSNLAFNGVSGNYIALTNGAENAIELNGTGVSYNGVVGSTATTAQAYAIEDKILDAIDTTGVGFVRIKNGNVYVTPNSYGGSATDDTGAVSRAVGVASDGDTVHVETGTYHETQVFIGKGLTLVGDSQAGVVIDGGGVNNTINGSSGLLHVEGTTAGQSVTIQSLTVQNAGTPSDENLGDYASTIEGYRIAGPLTIQNVTVVGDNDPTAFDAGLQIVFGDATANVTVQNVDISKAYEGALVEDVLGTINVSSSNIHGLVPGSYNGSTYNPVGLFVLLDSGSNDTNPIILSNNTVAGYTGDGLIVEAGYGGLVNNQGSASLVQITGNTVSVAGNGASDIEILSSDASTASGVHSANISGNTLSGTSTGYAGVEIGGYNTGISVTNNTITGTNTGVRMYGGASVGGPSATISGNNISSVATAGIEVDTGTATVTSGTVTGSGNGVLVTGGAANVSGGSYTGNSVGFNVSGGKLKGQGTTLTGNTEGVIVSGGAVVDLGDTSNSNTTGLGSSTGNNDLSGYNGASGHYAIDDQNTVSQPNVRAQNDNFGQVSSSNQAFIGTVIHDHADDSSLSTVIYTPAANATTQPTVVYVSPSFAGTALGTDPDGTGPATIYGYDAFPDIQDAIDAVATGGIVVVEAGTYSQNVAVYKAVSINGSSTSTVNVSAPSGLVFNVSSSNVTIQGLSITGGSRGVNLAGTISGDTLNNLSITGQSFFAIEVDNGSAVSSLTVSGVNASTGNLVNGAGFNVATNGGVNGLVITNSHFDNNAYGLYTNANSASTTNQNQFTNINVSSSTFSNDALRGIYTEKLDRATFDNITVANSGTVAGANGVDINLKYGTYSTISITNSTFTNDGNNSSASVVDHFAVSIKGRNDGSYAGNPASLSGVTLTNDTITGSTVDLDFENNVTGVSLSSLALNGSGYGLTNSITAAGALSLGDTHFASTLAKYVLNPSANGVDGTAATFGAVGPTDNTLADLYGVDDKIVDGVDVAGFGLVRLRTGHVYVTPNSYYTPAGTTSPSIQRGINVASINDTVNVQAGTYTEAVNVNKHVTLLGANSGVDAATRAGQSSPPAESVIAAPSNGQTPLTISVSDITVDGFTVQGNTNANNVGGGVYLVPGVSGTHFVDNVVQNNILGIYLANASATDQAVIQHNLFRNNTNAGPSSGTDIYADNSTAGGVVQDVLISNNTFTNTTDTENSWALGISNVGTAPFTNINFLSNTVSNSGRGVYFYNTTNSNVSGNTFTSTSHYGVGLFGSSGTPANSGFTVTNNQFAGDHIGFYVSDDSAGDAYTGGLNLSSNNFTGTGTYIADESTLSFDASNNTYNGYSPTVGNTAAQFTLADRILDGVDVGGYGLVDIDPTHSTVYVTANSFNASDGTTTPSVQRAVNLAAAGKTVAINSGTYPGQVVVNKNLTLAGQGAGTILQGTANMASQFVYSGTNEYPVLYANGATVNVFDLTVDGNNLGNTNGYGNGITGIAYVNAGGSVNGVSVVNTKNPTLGGNQGGVGVLVTNLDGVSRTFNFSQGSVSAYQKNGFNLRGAGLTANITNNTITGAGSTGVIAQNGVQVGFGAVGIITGNTISGNQYTNTAATDAADVLLYQAGAGTTVSGNTLNVSNVAVYAYQNAGTTTISYNNVTNANDGAIVSDDNTAEIANNDIHGNSLDGIELYDSNNGTTIHNNFIQTSGRYGILVDSSVTDTSTLAINNNNIAGNATDGLLSQSSVTIDATTNYWGSPSGPAAYNSTGGQIGFGTGDKLQGDHITYSPFLTDGTDSDNSRATGFQPVTGSLGVDIAGASQTSEGSTYTLYLDPSSPGNAAVTGYDINFGDGSAVVHVTGNPASITHVYVDGPNDYTITGVAHTTSGDAATNSVSVHVNNVAPSNVTVSATGPINENGTTTLTGTFTDPGNQDTHAVTINWGDGSTDTVLNLAAGVTTIPATTHQYLDNRPSNAAYNISVTVADAQSSATGSTTVVVNNVAPTASLTTNTSGPYNEGSGISLTATATDPGTLDAAAGYTFSYTITKTHNSVTTTYATGGTAAGAQNEAITFTPDDDGTYVVTVTATDKDGATSVAATQSFTIGNVAPSNVTVSATGPINENGTTTLTGSFTDPGTQDTHTVTINWGDGSTNTTLNLAAGVTTIPSTTHQYLDNRPANAAYTIGVTVTDNSNTSATGSTTVVVNNVAPTASLTTNTAGPYSEGSGISLTATATDPGTVDAAAGYTFSYTITKTHNSVTTTYATGGTAAGAQNEAITFTPDDDGTYVVTVTATDKDGATSVAATQSFTVGNVAPSNVSVSATSPENENGTTTLTGNFTDPGTQDTHTVTISWGDGSTNTVLNLAAGVTTIPSTTHQYLDNRPSNAAYTITVTVADQDGGSAQGTTSTVVNNVAPVASLTNVPGTSPEGTAITVTGNASDPGSQDTETYSYTVTRNGSSYSSATHGPTLNRSDSYTFTPATNGTYVVTLTVTDKDGGVSSTVSQTITVTDVAPTVALTGSKTDNTNTSPNDAEGSTFTLTIGPVVDPGNEAVSNYFINWGDGSAAQQITAAQLDAQGRQVTHVYPDGTVPPGTTASNVTITVDIQDSNGFEPGAGSLGIVVYNVAPTATFSGSNSVNEGNSGTVLFFNQFDPSSVDTSAGFRYSYDFNNDGVFEITNSTSPSASVPASYLSTPGTVTVRGRIMDKDGGFNDYTRAITVSNVNPTVNALSNVSTPAGTAFSETGGFTDPGNDNPYSVYVNYNYDPSTNPGQGTLVQSGSSHSFTVGTTYNTPGTYTVRVTVVDNFGGTGYGQFTVTVTPVTFAVSTFTPTPSGFDVTFNKPLDTSALNIYHGLPGSPYGASDIIVTGPSGTVVGSATFDAATNTLHFIKTGSVLPAGGYSVTLRSGSDAFKSTSGEALTVGGSAGDYTTTFNITSVGDIVFAPDYARGPGQSFTEPLKISEGAGVTAVDFDLVYDATRLTIATPTASDFGPSIPSGWSVTVNDSTPGHLRLTLSGTSSLPSGTVTLLNLRASIPTGAIYTSGVDLQVTNLRINEGNIAGTADSAAIKVAFIGDASGNRGYSAFDSSLISNVVVGNATGFDAYPLFDPVIVADVTGDGTLSGLDASYVAQKSVGLPVSQIPDLPAGNTTTSPTPGYDPTVNIPTNVLENPGATFTIPVNISDTNGLLGANFSLGFDASKLQFVSGVVGAADPNFAIYLNPDNTAGTLQLGLANNSFALGSGSGSIALLTFTVKSTAATGVTPVSIAGSQGGLNEGALPLTPVNGSIDIENGTVGSTFVYYNGSTKFDVKANNNLADFADFAAEATDKSPLLPGNTATFANYSTYSLGLNGILVEFVNMTPGATFTAGDFTFKIGNNNDPSTWTTAPAPVSVTAINGSNGHVYADLIWANNAIQNTWLQVVVGATVNTHLSSAYTFYYGNVIGETGDSTINAIVNGNDTQRTQTNQTLLSQAGITNVYDFNRDGRVNASDISIVQTHQSLLNPVKLITVPATPIAPTAMATSTDTGGTTAVATSPFKSTGAALQTVAAPITRTAVAETPAAPAATLLMPSTRSAAKSPVPFSESAISDDWNRLDELLG